MKKLLLLLGACLVSPGFAEVADYYTIAKPGTVRVGAFTGMPVGGEVIEQNPILGVDIIYQATSKFSIEGTAVFFREELPEQTLVDDGVAFGTTGRVNMQILSLLARLQMPVSYRWSVYGTGGVGYHRFDTSGEHATLDPSLVPESFSLGDRPLDVSIGNEFGLHLGGGITCTLSEFFEFFAEYRYTAVERSISYNGSVTVERDAEVTVPGETPGSSVMETRRITRQYSGKAEDDSGYDHGLVRVGINCYF
jgi:opacity protein-like surface antigen